MVFYVNELILQDIAICKEIRIRLQPSPEEKDARDGRQRCSTPTYFNTNSQ